MDTEARERELATRQLSTTQQLAGEGKARMPQVEENENDGTIGPENDHADTYDADIPENVPSTEAEIELGINQDPHTGEGSLRNQHPRRLETTIPSVCGQWNWRPRNPRPCERSLPWKPDT